MTLVGDFDRRSLASAMAARLAQGRPGREARFLSYLVQHLHGLVRETEPTREEWRAAIDFLTEVGHVADDRRQEWVLLSDLLGVSALVESLNSRRPAGATRNTVRGPFYRPGAPRLPLGASISLDRVGEPLAVSGRVLDLDGRAVVGAEVETWQANGEGWYENQEPDLQPEWNLRGVFRTDADGRFAYETVKPGESSLPANGPVGHLFQRLGLPLRRPAQLHFLVRADGFDTLVTEVFDSSDPRLKDDALFGARDGLLTDFRPVPGEGRRWSLELAFVLARVRPEGRQS